LPRISASRSASSHSFQPPPGKAVKAFDRP
jgi:hypothetical protein